jgi:acetyl esterase/lipase
VDFFRLEDRAMPSPSATLPIVSFAPWVVAAALVAVVAGRGPAYADEPPAKPAAVKVLKNVSYRPAELGEVIPLGRLADLYLPEDVKDFDVVVLVHGGGWVGGDKALGFDRIPDVALCLARQCVGVVAVNYRLAPWARHPAQVQDVAAAVAWTHKHIAEYGGSPKRIFLMGHSAGGHLVSLLAADDRYLRKAGLGREHIKGVVSVSGVYQVTDVACKLMAGDRKAVVEVEAANPFAVAFGNDPDVARQASPLEHVGEKLPPFQVVYAERDLPGLADQAVQFAAALREKKNDVRLLKIADRNHVSVFSGARDPDDPLARAVLEFVRKDRR